MAVVLTAALITPFLGHTVDQLEAWQDDWSSRASDTQTVELMDEWRDMHSRHLWFFDPQPKEVATAGRTRPPATAPPPGNSGMGNNVEQWRNLVAAYFPADQVDHALRVMQCESGGNPNAYNPSGASGLMQVLASWADNFGLTPAQLFDPATNLQVARYLWDDGGWGHWNASRGCW